MTSDLFLCCKRTLPEALSFHTLLYSQSFTCTYIFTFIAYLTCDPHCDRSQFECYCRAVDFEAVMAVASGT